MNLITANDFTLLKIWFNIDFGINFKSKLIAYFFFTYSIHFQLRLLDNYLFNSCRMLFGLHILEIKFTYRHSQFLIASSIHFLFVINISITTFFNCFLVRWFVHSAIYSHFQVLLIILWCFIIDSCNLFLIILINLGYPSLIIFCFPILK